MQRAEKSIRVNAPAQQVYQFWRNFENFPRFMEHVEVDDRPPAQASVAQRARRANSPGG